MQGCIFLHPAHRFSEVRWEILNHRSRQDRGQTALRWYLQQIRESSAEIQLISIWNIIPAAGIRHRQIALYRSVRISTSWCQRCITWFHRGETAWKQTATTAEPQLIIAPNLNKQSFFAYSSIDHDFLFWNLALVVFRRKDSLQFTHTAIYTEELWVGA